MAQKQVVIVGGGFAGLQAARHLGRVAGVAVTLLDRHNHHLFQPMLYQVATAALGPTEIARPIRSILRKYPNVTVLQAEVTGVDLARRLVRTTHTRVPYDYLLLAAGAENSYFGHDDWRPLAPGLKTMHDAVTIRNRLLRAFEAAERESDPERRRCLLCFSVIGGGYTGVELAGAIAELARYTLARDFRRIRPAEARVVLIEAGTTILPDLPVTLIRYAERVLASLKVELMTDRPVTALSPDAVTVGEERIPCGTVLWAAGTRASGLGALLPVEPDRHGRAPVGADLSLTGYPEVFVAGDMARCAVDGGRALPAIAPVAFQQGLHVARNIRQDLAGRPRRPFRYWNKGELAAIGRNRAVGMVGRHPIRGRLAWLIWVFVHIYYLTDFRNRLIVMLQWAWTYLADSRGARLIMDDGALQEEDK